MITVRSPWLLGLIGIAAIAAVSVIAVSVGSVSIPPVETMRVLLDHLLPVDLSTSDIADSIIWNIRLPRVIAALGAGAALGLAGVTVQGLFRNRAADPQLIGMSAIGSIGVLIGLWAGWTLFGPIAGVVGGAISGAAGALAIRWLSRVTEGDPSRFVLTGVGFGVAISSLVAAAAVAIHDPRIPDTAFWFVGGLGGATWGTAGWVTTIGLLSLLVVLPFGERLDIFSLGMASASHLGVNVVRVMVITLVAVGAGVGAAVGAAGVVAFVGLLSGHLARQVVGDHHRRALATAFVIGGMILVMADAAGRLIGGRFEVPVGLVTALVGGPYLVWLITRRGSTT
jgi:ABC-type Fe3+-siderophore transport system permease subunit